MWVSYSVKSHRLLGALEEQFNWQMEEMVTGSEISDFFSAAESGKGCWCAAGE